MTLQPALIAYLNGQIAAGLSPEQLRFMLQVAVDRWGMEADRAEMVSYVYDRLRADEALGEALRMVLARSVADNEAIGMPAEMDAHIRQRLFNRREKKVTQTPAIHLGRDHPHFELAAVDPDWKTAGPVLSRLVWMAGEYERVWTDSEGSGWQAAARRSAILWRALARAGHLDFTAITELQACQEMQPLDEAMLAELEDLRAKMLRMLNGIDELLDAARVKERHV